MMMRSFEQPKMCAIKEFLIGKLKMPISIDNKFVIRHQNFDIQPPARILLSYVLLSSVRFPLFQSTCRTIHRSMEKTLQTMLFIVYFYLNSPVR